MAFLCPVKIRRGKKKKSANSDSDKEISRPGSGLGLNHGMGRITGSASIETLVRVGIEKEHGLSPDSKMVVLHDFTPCVDDELEVKRGQIVNILYRENDWVYVIGQDTRQEGFIPHSYCAPYNTQLADLAIKKKLPREQNISNDLNNDGVVDIILSSEILDDAAPLSTGIMGIGGIGKNENCISTRTTGKIGGTTGVLNIVNAGGSGSTTTITSNTNNIDKILSPLKHSHISLSSEPDFLPFAKDPSGRYIVLYTFIARDENDVSVERGEFVTVLNREDPDWFWIVRSDGQEGFIPSGFVYPADNVLQSKSLAQYQHQLNDNLNSNPINNNNANANSIGTTINNYNNNNNNNSNNNNANNNNNNNNNNSNNNNNNSNLNAHNQLINNGGGGGGNGNGGQQQQTHQQMVATDDLRYHGTELVMLYDYKAQAPDDLSVRRGDWIYADLNNQTVDGWLWAYAPKTRKYGFIPKAYARPPAMTSL